MGSRWGYDGVSKEIRGNPLPDTVPRPSRRRVAKRAQPHGIGRLSLRFIHSTWCRSHARASANPGGRNLTPPLRRAAMPIGTPDSSRSPSAARRPAGLNRRTSGGVGVRPIQGIPVFLACDGWC